MKCPSCGHLEDKVIDSRSAKEGQAIRRRREPFSREKILNGLLRACEKRPIPAERIHAIVDALEAELMQKGQDEVQSSEIGERLMTELHHLDEVAYVRFASVYRHFKDLNQFLEELRSLLK